jgi:hypothetical protein
MIGSMRIESLSGPESDQEQAKEFYVDALGYELLVDDAWREGMRWSEGLAFWLLEGRSS